MQYLLLILTNLSHLSQSGAQLVVTLIWKPGAREITEITKKQEKLMKAMEPVDEGRIDTEELKSNPTCL